MGPITIASAITLVPENIAEFIGIDDPCITFAMITRHSEAVCIKINSKQIPVTGIFSSISLILSIFSTHTVLPKNCIDLGHDWKSINKKEKK